MARATKLSGDSTSLEMLMMVSALVIQPACEGTHICLLGTNTPMPDPDPLDQCNGTHSAPMSSRVFFAHLSYRSWNSCRSKARNVKIRFAQYSIYLLLIGNHWRQPGKSVQHQWCGFRRLDNSLQNLRLFGVGNR